MLGITVTRVMAVFPLAAVAVIVAVPAVKPVTVHDATRVQAPTDATAGVSLTNVALVAVSVLSSFLVRVERLTIEVPPSHK